MFSNLFRCDNCGIETNGITYVNGMKFCAKCYHETFGKDNQQNEIQQLKQQLMELFKENTKLIIEKRQFAIQKLEKVKELILKIDNNHREIKTLKNGYSTLYIDSPTVMFIIDQQIKELKGE